VPYTLAQQPRFRAGFDFLRLRADAGEVPAELGAWWESFSTGDDDQRGALMDQARSHDGTRRRTAAPEPAVTDADEEPDDTAAEGAADAPRKRRRRRRKPAGAGGSGGTDSGAT
jgi:poly(A) polymerase